MSLQAGTLNTGIGPCLVVLFWHFVELLTHGGLAGPRGPLSVGLEDCSHLWFGLSSSPLPGDGGVRGLCLMLPPPCPACHGSLKSLGNRVCKYALLHYAVRVCGHSTET